MSDDVEELDGTEGVYVELHYPGSGRIVRTTVDEIVALAALGTGGGGTSSSQPSPAAVGMTLTQGAETALLGTSFDSPGPLRYSRYGTLVLGSFDFTAPAGFAGDVAPLTLVLPDLLPAAAADQVVGQGRILVGAAWKEIVLRASGRTLTVYGDDGTPFTTAVNEDDAGEGHFFYFAADATGLLEGQTDLTPTATQGAGTPVTTASVFGVDRQAGVTVGRLQLAFVAGTTGDTAALQVALGAANLFAQTGIVGYGLATIGGTDQRALLVAVDDQTIEVRDPTTGEAIMTPVDVGDSIDGWIIGPNNLGSLDITDSTVAVTQTETIVLASSSAAWSRRDQWVFAEVKCVVDSVTAPVGNIQVSVSGLPGRADGIDQGVGILTLNSVAAPVIPSMSADGSVILQTVDNTPITDALQAGDSLTIWLFYEASTASASFARLDVGIGANQVLEANTNDDDTQDRIAVFGAGGLTRASRPTLDPSTATAEDLTNLLIDLGFVIDGT